MYPASSAPDDSGAKTLAAPGLPRLPSSSPAAAGSRPRGSRQRRGFPAHSPRRGDTPSPHQTPPHALDRSWIGAGSSLAAGGPRIAGSARIWPARPCFVARLGCSRRGLPGGGDVGRSPCLDGMCAVGGCRGGGLGRRGRRGLSTGDGRGSWWSATSAVRAARSRWTSTTVGRGAPSPGVPASMKSDAFSGCRRSPGQVFGRVVGTGGGSGETLGRRRRPRQWRRLVGVGSLLGGLVEVLSRLSLCSSFGRKL